MPLRSEAGVVIGNVERKYDAGNPIARTLMNGFLDSFDGLLRRTGAREVHEIGCGEGHLAHRIARQGISVRACDFSREIIAEARTRYANDGISFAVKSVYDLDAEQDRAQTVVCCEVLEHVNDPEAALDRLRAITAEWCIMSVPREPLWRALNMARGKYLGELGNTPGHVQHWSKAGFLRLVGRWFDLVEARSPLPWTIALCRPKR